MGPVTWSHSTPLSPLLLEGAAVELPLLEDHEAVQELHQSALPAVASGDAPVAIPEAEWWLSSS